MKSVEGIIEEKLMREAERREEERLEHPPRQTDIYRVRDELAEEFASAAVALFCRPHVEAPATLKYSPPKKKAASKK